MPRIDANIPDTRARIAARRRMNRRSSTKAADSKASPKLAKLPPGRDRLRVQKDTAQRAPDGARSRSETARTSTRRHIKSSFALPSNLINGVRQRARLRMHRTQPGSQVRPGLRHVLMNWLVSGRLFSLLLFLASAGALVHLFRSPDFTVQQVQVEGNTILRDKDVVELAQVRGASIWFIDNTMIENRLLQNAYVEQARVSVALPNQATISLSERQPDIRWAVGGVQYLVDSSGRVLDIAQEPAEPETLIIVDSSSQMLTPMEHVDTDAMHVARELALRLPTELQFTPEMIGWDIGLGVYVRTESGQTIVFGQSEHLDRKIALLGHIFENGTVFSYLDLRPSTPYYRTEG